MERAGTESRRKKKGRQRPGCRPVFHNAFRIRLAVTATMGPATTVESPATVKSTPTVEAVSAMKPTAAVESLPPAVCAGMVSAANVTVAGVATTDVTVTQTVTPAAVINPRAAIPAVCITPVAEPPRTMEPRSRSDEHATSEPIRTVVSVRRASVRIVAVVAIFTNGRRSNCDAYWSNSDSHTHLRL